MAHVHSEVTPRHAQVPHIKAYLDTVCAEGSIAPCQLCCLSKAPGTMMCGNMTVKRAASGSGVPWLIMKQTAASNVQVGKIAAASQPARKPQEPGAGARTWRQVGVQQRRQLALVQNRRYPDRRKAVGKRGAELALAVVAARVHGRDQAEP